MTGTADIRMKRVYEAADASDGYRVLVDRLWPRGLSKQKAALDLWLKPIAPSPALRKWWGHDPTTYEAFAQRYRSELDDNPEPVELLCKLARQHPRITLLYAAKDPHVNHAVVLRDYILAQLVRR
ncbi:hypothetical protein KIM372_06050 [Bombiscardovia nodaiensis]|uniref:MarR family transcriptional regulator n=1 Tax=Bombiscardovia nodaiensis TaxID=2932181 RepID=A0ABN6SBW5_9BIFI|nr:hypothetical protein KIM372_06050 [Bombiscardovia nodaiensis]